MSFLDTLMTPEFLNAVGTGLQSGGQFLGAISRYQFGQEQQQAMQFQSMQLRQQATEAEASSQRTAWSTDLQTRYLASKALAIAGASGAGASDPTVVNVISHMAGIGAYQGATALYGGQDRARYLNLQASAKDYEGQILRGQSESAAKAQGIAGAASLLRGAARDASLYQRFAGDGPPRADATPNAVDYRVD